VNGYVAAGWAVTVASLVLYAWRTARRGRLLARSLPPEDRPWR